MPLKDHLNKLEYFCIIGKTGSLRKASEQARISQPRLTKVLQELEEILEVVLVVRTARGINLTKEGKLLFERSTELLKKVNEIEHNIRFGDTAPKGVVCIGAYDSIARYFISGFIKFISVAAPDLKFNMVTGRSSELMKKVEKEEVDLAIVVRPATKANSLDMIDIYSDMFDLYASPSMNDSFRNTLIYLPLELNDPEVSRKRFRFHQSIICESLETVLTLAEQGIGVALLPTLVTKESVLAKRLAPFFHPHIKNRRFDPHFIAICQSKRNINPTIEYVSQEMKRYFEHWK